MSNGMGPPLLLGSHPNCNDITNPKYVSNTKDWIKTLRQFPEATDTTMTLHKENDYTYQKVGNALTWERYVTLEYHAHDACFQFETQWERMKDNEMDVLTFIWHVYFYPRDMPMKLNR
jgi:hypothetical protein